MFGNLELITFDQGIGSEMDFVMTQTTMKPVIMTVVTVVDYLLGKSFVLIAHAKVNEIAHSS